MIGARQTVHHDGLSQDVMARSADADLAPHRALVAMILKTAIDDATCWVDREYTKHGETVSTSRIRAQRWIFNERKSEGSYAWYCALIGIDPDHSRDRLVARYGDRILEAV